MGRIGNAFHKPLLLLLALLLGATLATASNKVERKSSSTRASSVKSASRSHSKSARKATAKRRSSSRKRRSHRRHSSSRKHRRARVRGQTTIHEDRARQIQAALIQKGYLEGQPSGAWDQQTKEAMARYQSDNGWQIKAVPDSRALIKLGLGPSHSDNINAKFTPANLPTAGSLNNSELPQDRP